MKTHFPLRYGLFASLLFASITFAQKPNTLRPFEIPLNYVEPFNQEGDIQVSTVTGLALAIHNLSERVDAGAAEQQARQFLSQNAAQFGMDENLQSLRIRYIRESAAGKTVRFTQFFKNVPVYGPETVINISNQDRVTFVLNGHKPLPDDLKVQPGLGAEDARNMVIAHIGLLGQLDVDETRLSIYWEEGNARLCWVVRLVGESLIGDWESLVDAQTGEIFKCQDVSLYCGPGAHSRHGGKSGLAKEEENSGNNSEECVDVLPGPLPKTAATGTGSTFDADPLSSAGVAYGGAYVDGGDATNASLQAEVMTKTLLDITQTGPNYDLRGPYAWIYEFENPAKGIFTQASPNFIFNRNSDGFEASNTYFFVDMSMRYINTALGIPLMPYQYTQGVRFDPHGLNGADNSHYITSNGRMAFGEGGVDDAEDSDVILHELGHGLHDWVTVGQLSQVNGLSEGSGDYWAQSYSRSKGQWTTAQPAYHWVFNWDGHNPFWGGRTTNYGALYPGGLIGQIHTDGQIWSTCLMKIYDAIGRFQTDRAFLEGLALTNSTTNQQNAAIAFRQAAINMGYSMPELNQITNIFTGCGYIMPPFPVVYAYWRADRVTDLRVDLSWETASESQNDRFELLRRLDGEDDFHLVGTLAGRGTTDGPQTYKFEDFNSHEGISYYQLRQVDLDGGSAHSEVIAVDGRASRSFGFSVAPNPVGSVLEAVLATAPTQTRASYEIVDLAGRKIMAGECRIDNGEIAILLSGKLGPGVYILRLSVAGETAIQRFVKK